MVAVSKDALRSSSPVSILHSGDTTMTEPTTQPVKIDGYHAHVYYDPTTGRAPRNCGKRSPARSALRSGN
jgi:hypothetical protein